MVKLSLTKLAAVALGGLALSLTAGAGAASADTLDTVVNTTCNYNQIIKALNATDPGAAAQLNAQPLAVDYLHRFLAAPPDARRQMAAEVQVMPGAAQYFDLVAQVAGSCNNY